MPLFSLRKGKAMTDDDNDPWMKIARAHRRNNYAAPDDLQILLVLLISIPIAIVVVVYLLEFG
jgi:hypothetical protein